jgi:uncharacterized protein HemX
MEERKVPPPQRGNIDGIRPRKPNIDSQPAASASASTPTPTEPKQAERIADRQPKKGKNLLAIISAIIIFIGLSSLAVYMGLQQDSGSTNPDKINTVQDGSGADTSQLIDQTVNDIDQLDDQPDGSGEGLSDEKLGL